MGRVFLGILAACLLGPAALSRADGTPDFAEQARTISSRLKNGVPYAPTDAQFQSMVSLLQSGDALGAADIPTHDRDFLEQTVRQLAAPMLNLARSAEDNALTDAMALIIGTVRDDRYFPEILYTTAQYVVKSAQFNSTRSTYSKWDPTTTNLATSLVRIDDGSDPNGYKFPAQDVAGVLTTDKWALEYDSAGTNRRNIKGLMQLVNLDIDGIRASNPNLVYIARDVTRVPDPFQPNLFFTYCSQCHGVIDAQRDAFFHVDYGALASGGMGIIPVPAGAAKYSINTTKFPGGHITTDTSWSVTMAPAVQDSLGWPKTDLAGTGIHSLGTAWSKLQAFHRGMVQRVAAQVCPGVALERATVDQLTAAFETDGNLRSLYKQVVILPVCLGN